MLSIAGSDFRKNKRSTKAAAGVTDSFAGAEEAASAAGAYCDTIPDAPTGPAVAAALLHSILQNLLTMTSILASSNRSINVIIAHCRLTLRAHRPAAAPQAQLSVHRLQQNRR